MIVNQKENIINETVDPGSKKVNIKKAKEFIFNLYKEGGRSISEEYAEELASSKNLKEEMVDIYRYSGNYKTIPKDKGLSIYNSFLIQDVVEKKNPIVRDDINIPGIYSFGDSKSQLKENKPKIFTGKELNKITGQNPVVEFKASEISSKKSFEIDKKEDPDEDKVYFDFTATYKDLVNRLPKSIFNEQEEDFVIKMSQDFSAYGLKFKSKGLGNKVTITNSQNESEDFQLFTQDYKNSQKRQYFLSGLSDEEINKKIEEQEARRFNSLLVFLNDSASSSIDFQRNEFINANIEDLPNKISNWISSQIRPANQDDLIFVQQNINPEGNYEVYMKNPDGSRGFNQELWEEDLNIVKNKKTKAYNTYNPAFIKDPPFLSSIFNKKLRKKVEGQFAQKDKLKKEKEFISFISTEYDDTKKYASSNIGNLLRTTGVYKKIDLNDRKFLSSLEIGGFKMADMPLDEITINGKPSSFNDLSKVLYDYDQLLGVREGKIKIDIKDPKTAGLLAGYVQNAKDLIRTQEAYRHKGVFGWMPKQGTTEEWIYNKIDQSAENVENFVQSVGLGGWEIAVNTAYIFYDSLIGLGFDTEEAEAIVYGSTGLSGAGNLGMLLNPKFYNKVRNEVLPKYEGGITEIGSAGEFLAKIVEPVGNSMAISSVFILNPTAGISTVGVSGYGGNLKNYDEKIQAIKEKKSQGLFLTDTEINLLNLGDVQKRLLSIGKASSEVALTSLFTYRYFKSIKNTLPKDAKITDIRKFANSYSKQFKKEYTSSLSRLTGINAELLANEVVEEELVAFTNYAMDIAVGHDTYDPVKAKNLFIDTGIVSALSSKVVGDALKFYNKKQVRKTADGVIFNNISVENESKVYQNKIIIDSEIKKLENELSSTETPLESSTQYQRLIVKQSSIDTEISMIVKRKNQLIKSMSHADKIIFLEGFAASETAYKNLNDTSKPASSRVQAREDLIEVKKKLSDILSKYPSELSYFFATNDIKSQYAQKAMNLISEQKVKNGETDFELKDTDTEVKNKAAELYLEDIKNKKREFFQDAYVFEGRGLGFDPSDLYVTVTDDERNNFNLRKELEFSKNIDSQGRIFDPEIVIERTEDVELTTKLNKEKSEVDLKINLENKRRLNIINKIESFNVDGSLFNNLSAKQQDIIIDYFKDVRAQKKPRYGKIETILDAYDIAVNISAKTPEKINLLTDQKGKGVLRRLFNSYNNLSQSIYAGGMTGYDAVTVDVLKQMLFKDTKIGAPFNDLVAESVGLSAEGENISNDLRGQHIKDFEKDVKEYNRKNKKSESKNPNERIYSYEQTILSLLSRRTGKIDEETGLDTEFVRAKKIILDERDKAEEEYLSHVGSNKLALKKKFEDWNSLIKKLDVENAKSYEDVSKKAFPFNVNAIKRLNDAFALSYDGMVSRINDFTKNDPFIYEKGSYSPMFLRDDSWESSYSDYFGMDKDNSEVSSNSLKQVTRPESLKAEGANNNLRLSPGLYFSSAYSALRGANMDIKAHKSFETLNNLIENPLFQNLFEDGPQKELILEAFKKRKKFFEKEIRRTNNTNVDITNPKHKSIISSLMNSAYGTVSAVVLTRLTQGPSQFTSAWAGSYPLIRSEIASDYLRRRFGQYFIFSNSLANGNKAESYKQKIMQQYSNNGRLSNIYSKSRTGLRNSVLAELSIDQNQKLPLSYYANAFNIDTESNNWSSFLKTVGETSQYTFDTFINLVNKSNKLSLDVFLANSDKLAAYTAFEAHYLDYKVGEGEKIGDLDSWWEKQNENPDLKAIQHADYMVGRVMRQTDAVSEADIYQQDQSQTIKNALRTIYPFQKFIINKKGDLSNQFSILLDDNIPQDQKEFAKKVIQGGMAEILSFNIIKNAGKIAMINGLGGLLSLGVEDEDIEERGGIDKWIREKILPITSDVDIFSGAKSDVTNLEDYEKFVDGVKYFNEASGQLQNFTKKYSDKEIAKQVFNPTEFTIRDFVSTMNPIPVPDLLEEYLVKKVNDTFGTDMTEFISRDIEDSGTTDSRILSVIKNAGLVGITVEQADAFERAMKLKNKGIYTKFSGDLGKDIDYYLSAPNDPIRERLKTGVDILFFLRLLSLTLPGGPRAELKNIADGVERNIDMRFLSSNPDPYYYRILGVQGPIEEPEKN